MGFELTPQSLKKLCRELKLYSSCPELNDVLYLHQKGIVKLKHLDAYTGLKSLHLECNAISTIEGLDALIQLRCLFLNQNLVEYVQGLESLGQLETIDLADNQIKEIKGLACCTKLRQLNLSGNRIRSEEDVSHLLECKSLVSLDIGKNRIDSEDALKVVRRLPLNLLRLSGNPIVSTTKHYRKATLTSMSKLQYLDESPVFEKERRLAQAWLEGGPQAEQDMREKIKQEEAAEREAHRRAFDEMVGKAKAESALSNEAKARMDVTNVTKENRERADETPSILVDENPDHAGNMDSGSLDEPDPDQHSKLIEKFHSSDMDNGEKDGRNTDSVSIEDVLYYSTQYDQNSELDTMSNLDRLNMNQEDSFHYTEVDGMTHDASHANIFTPEPDAVDLEEKDDKAQGTSPYAEDNNRVCHEETQLISVNDTSYFSGHNVWDDAKMQRDSEREVSEACNEDVAGKPMEMDCCQHYVATSKESMMCNSETIMIDHTLNGEEISVMRVNQDDGKVGGNSEREIPEVQIPCDENVMGECMEVDQHCIATSRKPLMWVGDMRAIDNALTEEENSTDTVSKANAHERDFKVYTNPGYEDSSAKKKQDDPRLVAEDHVDIMCPSLKLEDLKRVIEKERIFMKSLQKHALQRAAAETEGGSRLKKELDGGEQEESCVTRPVIWGTTTYKELWRKATYIDDVQDLNQNANLIGDEEEEDAFDSVAGEDDVSEKLIQAVVSTPI